MDTPTPSFFFQSWSPTKLQFIFLFVCPFFFFPPQTAFREGCCPSKLVLNSLVSVTSLLTSYFNQKIDLASGWEIFACLWCLGGFWFGFGFF